MAGLVSFHDAQKLIMRYRQQQIARFKVIFPELSTGLAKKRLNRVAKPAQTAARQSGDVTLRKTEVVEGAAPGPSFASTKGPTVGRFGGGEATRGGGAIRKAKFSADVAPAEMFMKDVGFTPAGVANHVREISPMLLAETMIPVNNTPYCFVCLRQFRVSYWSYHDCSWDEKSSCRLQARSPKIE